MYNPTADPGEAPLRGISAGLIIAPKEIPKGQSG